ncbi:MAG: GNAT family N-acetyltransferase [Opitutae bacterium]|nr:GNAT family N-acetyltransferase [Opitutae bacterium]
MPYPAQPPLIETPRLRLRPFLPADGPFVQRLAGVREVADTALHIPHPYPDGAAEAWINTHATRWAAHEELVLAITLPDGGHLVGAVGLVLEPQHDRAELGYWVGVPFWRRGFATEAAGGLVDFGFKVLGLNRVQAQHMARNPASGRVMLKLGLRREGASPRAVKKNGRYEDVVFYGLLRRDWPGCSSAAPFPVS